jgi:hypothetical protein
VVGVLIGGPIALTEWFRQRAAAKDAAKQVAAWQEAQLRTEADNKHAQERQYRLYDESSQRSLEQTKLSYEAYVRFNEQVVSLQEKRASLQEEQLVQARATNELLRELIDVLRTRRTGA